MDADQLQQLLTAINNLYVLGQNLIFLMGAVVAYFAASMAVRGLNHGK